MNNTKKTDSTDFLDYVNKLLALKSKPKTPPLDDPRWTTYFDSTFDARRETLSQAWFRCAERESTKGRKQPIEHLREIFYNNRAWLEKLQPYIGSSHVWQEVFHLDTLHFAHIFAGESCSDETSQVIRQLWFGEEKQKLNALIRAGEIAENCKLTMYGKTFIAQLAWRAATLQTAQREHTIAACKVSYWSGFLFGDAELEPSEEAWAWHMLGTYTKGGDQFDPKIYKTDHQKSIYAELKNLPSKVYSILIRSKPEVMLDLFKTIFQHAKRNKDGHELTSGSLLGNVCPPGSNAYTALAHWVPQQAGVIKMAELNGLDLDETLQIVRGLITQPSVVSQQLPTDFKPDLEI